MKEELRYIVEPNEEECIALRVRSTIVYAYPFNEEVAKTGAKVVTKKGELVKHVQPATKDGERIIVGELDGERLTWDIDGKFAEDDDKNLYIFERYWDAQWKTRIKLSHSEWCLKYQREHKSVKVEDRWDEKAKRQYNG